MRRSSTTALAVVAIAAGVTLLGAAGVAASGNGPGGDGRATGTAGNSAPANAEPATDAGQDRFARAIEQTQERLRDNPRDAAAWATLGGAYVERARVTADPAYHGKAREALQRSLDLAPEGNGPALIGMGALSNARHEFAAARDWALRAQAVLPDNAQVYGVLADALTQLGEYPQATAAIQRMLDLRPSVASFSRASYDLELHGRTAEARQAMERALAGATSPDEVAFCRYQLGDLAFEDGRLDDAQRHYEAVPNDLQSRHGLAKVAAARGHLDQALDAYRRLVADQPLPHHLEEYAELLTVAGERSQAEAQYALMAEQLRLVRDDLESSILAATRGDGETALRLARAEWDRRKHVEVADALAWALHLTGQDAEALTFADRAAALGGADPMFTYHRGMILLGLGRTEPAVKALATALRMNPYFSPVHAPQARATLGLLAQAL